MALYDFSFPFPHLFLLALLFFYFFLEGEWGEAYNPKSGKQECHQHKENEKRSWRELEVNRKVDWSRNNLVQLRPEM